MSHEIMNKVWKLDLTHTEKIVMLSLANYHNSKTGQCNPSQDTIASDCGLGKRHVIRVITRLKERRLIDIKRAARTGNNEYIFTIPEVTPRALREVTPETPRRGDSQSTSEVTCGALREVTPRALREVTSDPFRSDICDTLRSDICDTPLIRKNQDRRTKKEPIAADAAKKQDEQKTEPVKSDEIFEAIAEVCSLDWKAHGSIIGKAKKKLLDFKVPATADEIRLYGRVYEKQHPVKKVPTWTELVNGFGIVRNEAKVQSILNSNPFGTRGGNPEDEATANYQDVIPWKN